MNTITQITTRRQAIIKYAKKKGVTAAARRYNVGRATIYRWMKRYDGTLESLKGRSHRPHSHPNQHTEEEIKLIKDMRQKNKHTGLVFFYRPQGTVKCLLSELLGGIGIAAEGH